MKTVLDFSEQKFADIPAQDNPAYATNSPCIMVVLSNSRHHDATGCKYTVLEIEAVEDPVANESVTHMGLFWNRKQAFIFAKTIARV